MKLFAIMALLGNSLVFADISIDCEHLSEGVVTSICSTSISNSKGSGELVIQPQESTELSTLNESCINLGNFDLVIENTSKVAKLKENASETDRLIFETNELIRGGDNFKFSIVTFKVKRGKRKKVKSRQSLELKDHSLATVSGNISYVVNGNGISCKMSN